LIESKHIGGKVQPRKRLLVSFSCGSFFVTIVIQLPVVICHCSTSTVYCNLCNNDPKKCQTYSALKCKFSKSKIQKISGQRAQLLSITHTCPPKIPATLESLHDIIPDMAIESITQMTANCMNSVP